MNTSWTALRNPTFRRLWIAGVISGTCVAAHDSAATYVMSTLAASPFLISLMSTVASLPFFLFTLPAGVLADRVNRKKLACVINVWLAAIAVALAILGWLHLLNPCLILISVFLLGGGFALNAPTWTSIVPQVVSDNELPSAATLSGLQFNISGIIDRSELSICSERRLLSLGDSLDSAMEATNGVAKGFFARLLLLYRDYYPLPSLRTRASDCASPKFSVHIVHFRNPGGSTGGRPQSIAP